MPAPSSLATLVLRTSEPLPAELLPTAVADIAPNVIALHFHELNAMHGDSASLSAGFVSLAEAFPDLQKLQFKDATMDMIALERFCDTAVYPCLEELSFVKCRVDRLTHILQKHAEAGRMLRSLELTNQLSVTEIAVIGKSCKNVTELGLRVHRDSIGGLKTAIENMKELHSLSLLVMPGGNSVDEEKRMLCQSEIVAVLLAVGPKFGKFVLHGESISVAGLTNVFMRLGKQVEYVVTGILAPRKSRSKCIMQLLGIVKSHCPEMRILCFGLDLLYDPRAEELHEQLLATIQDTKNRLRRLDPIWLYRNASSLMSIPRPVGFVDYESDDSFMGEDVNSP